MSYILFLNYDNVIVVVISSHFHDKSLKNESVMCENESNDHCKNWENDMRKLSATSWNGNKYRKYIY